MPEKFSISRRTAFKWGGLLGGSVVAGLVDGSGIMPNPIEPANNQGAVWVPQGEGFVSHEDELLMTPEGPMRVRTHIAPILDSIRAIASHLNVSGQVETYLKDNPPRIALQRGTATSTLAYFPRNRVHHAQFQASTNYLARTYEASHNRGPDTTAYLGKGAAHEFSHLVSDASSSINAVGQGLQTAEHAAFIGGILLIGAHTASLLRRRDRRPTNLSQMMRSVGPMIVAGMLGFLTPTDKVLYKINPAEIEAYRRQDELAALPGVAQNSGRYFSFEPA